ncbi:MAG: hypothetical protein MUF33_01795 [Candidatus Nanopelagicales bacterium]|nr:hypothetical protein [Candidatus Nanopelagicales bacterium]
MSSDEPRTGPQEPPWWHSTPQQPPVDSVMAEGMKLAAALRDWAVDSGAMAAAAGLAQSAAVNASAYIAAVQAPVEDDLEAQADADAEPVEVTVRCDDCPVCQGLDALESANPQLADKARVALAGVNTLLMGFLRSGEDETST